MLDGAIVDDEGQAIRQFVLFIRDHQFITLARHFLNQLCLGINKQVDHQS